MAVNAKPKLIDNTGRRIGNDDIQRPDFSQVSRGACGDFEWARNAVDADC